MEVRSEDAHTLEPQSSKPARAWKGLGLGALGLGLACLGCCLAPLTGLLFATGAGAAVGGLAGESLALGGLAVATVAALAAGYGYWTWRSRRSACCPATGPGCGAGACDARRT